MLLEYESGFPFGGHACYQGGEMLVLGSVQVSLVKASLRDNDGF